MHLTLKEYFARARKNKSAIGHFNFATLDVLRAIIEASREAGSPAVMAGTSEGEAEFVGLEVAVAAVTALREKLNYPVFLNADHFKNFEKCKAAIDAGYDSVLIDASKLAFEENVALTKRVVEYARDISKLRNIDISVEGELGYLRGSSEVQTAVKISPEDYTQRGQARGFLERTGVDRLAIVFGNIHGIVTQQEERLDLEHLVKIAAAVPDACLVLHGASGLPKEQIIDAIKNGVSNVHFNTELRVAYRQTLEKTLRENPDETTPYKYLALAQKAVKRVVTEKINWLLANWSH